MRRLIATTLAVFAGCVLALAVTTSATGVAAAEHHPIHQDSCPPLDESFCVVEEDGASDGIPVSSPVGILLIALLWVAPLVLAAVFASRNNENIRSAIFLTVFLGWIGLYIAYRGQRRSAASLMRAAQPRPGSVRT